LGVNKFRLDGWEIILNTAVQNLHPNTSSESYTEHVVKDHFKYNSV